MSFSFHLKLTLENLFPSRAEKYAQAFTAEDYPVLNHHFQRMAVISKVFSLSIASSLFTIGLLFFEKINLTNRIKVALAMGIVFDLTIVFISTVLLNKALKSDMGELNMQDPNIEDQIRFRRERRERFELRIRQLWGSK